MSLCSVLRSGITGVIMYVVPIFCILLVLPASKVSGIGGFIDAVTLTFHGVYGGAAHPLLVVMTLCFVGALVTSGSVWMIGSDRIQAVASYDGAFFPFFGIFNRRLGTPVRVNVLSGITASAFSITAIYLLKNASTAAAFTVVLDIAISTTLLSYLWIFPAVLKLPLHASRRAQAVPASVGHRRHLGVDDPRHVLDWRSAHGWPSSPTPWSGCSGSATSSSQTWGVTEGTFEALTLGTLAVIVVIGLIGLRRRGRRPRAASRRSPRARPGRGGSRLNELRAAARQCCPPPRRLLLRETPRMWQGFERRCGIVFPVGRTKER